MDHQTRIYEVYNIQIHLDTYPNGQRAQLQCVVLGHDAPDRRPRMVGPIGDP